MISEKEYDWEQTKVKVVLLIPNYGRKSLLTPTIKRISTQMDKDDYHILVANDGLHEDMSDLSDFNVSYFTFNRKNKNARNGSFIRNYCIKRIQSEFLIQKDPEVLVEGDFLKSVVDMNEDIFTLGSVVNTDSKQLEQFMKNGKLPPTNSKRVLSKGVSADLHPNILNIRTKDTYYFFHYMYGCRVDLLQSIGGYDEAYSMYGKEDKDLYFRLKDMGASFMSAESCKAYHLWHKRVGKTKKSDIAMSKIYKERQPSDHVRNKSGCGEG